MTNSQRIHLMTLWGKACKAQGWKSSDSELRHQLYSAVLGKPKRFSDFNEADFSAVKARLLALADSIPGVIEVDHPELHQKRQYLWKVHNEFPALLRFYGHDPETYIYSVIRDKFQAYKGLKTIKDLSATSSNGRPSQLLQLVMTLSARIDDMRRDAGHSKLEMEVGAGLIKAPAPELATAGAGDSGEGEQPF